MEVLNTTKKPAAEIISAANLQALSERIAVRALKTCYQKGGQPFIYSLYCDLIADINDRKNNPTAPLSDGYDIAQVAAATLWEYNGKSTDAPSGKTDKKGAPITVWRDTFRAVNRYIMGQRQYELKRVYLDDIDEAGQVVYITIPAEWDLPTVTDYRRVMQYITAMGLSNNEKRVLTYRMRGKTYTEIARIIGTTKATIAGYQTRIKAKARKIPEIQDALSRYRMN